MKILVNFDSIENMFQFPTKFSVSVMKTSSVLYDMITNDVKTVFSMPDSGYILIDYSRHNAYSQIEYFGLFKYRNFFLCHNPVSRGFTMGVLLNGLNISAEGELQSLCCMMGKTMSLRCHFLAANGWLLID